MSKRKTVQVSEESHEILTRLCQKHSIKMRELVGYLADTAKMYGLIDPDWKDNLVSVALEEYKRKFDEKLSRDLEKERVKAIQRITHTMISKYLDALEPEERKSTIEGMLGDLKTGNILEKLADMELATIDGKKRLVKMVDGMPSIGIDPEKLIPCDMGYHLVGNFCTCRRWRDCPIRSEEYQDYKRRTDPMYRGLLT